MAQSYKKSSFSQSIQTISPFQHPRDLSNQDLKDFVSLVRKEQNFYKTLGMRFFDDILN